jgi:hypothetical protein
MSSLVRNSGVVIAVAAFDNNRHRPPRHRRWIINGSPIISAPEAVPQPPFGVIAKTLHLTGVERTRPPSDSPLRKRHHIDSPRRPAHRLEVHNASIDEQVADAGGCAQIHLATGRTCTLAHTHQGTCEFVTANPATVPPGRRDTAQT